MKIICIDNKYYSNGTYVILPLTINKSYDVISEMSFSMDFTLKDKKIGDPTNELMPDLYLIIDDDRKQDTYSTKRFKLLYEYREDKINKILS